MLKSGREYSNLPKQSPRNIHTWDANNFSLFWKFPTIMWPKITLSSSQGSDNDSYLEPGENIRYPEAIYISLKPTLILSHLFPKSRSGNTPNAMSPRWLNLYGGALYFWILSMELVSFHSSSAKNFEVALRYFVDLGTPTSVSSTTFIKELCIFLTFPTRATCPVYSFFSG
jgi:hypothetical protein